MPSIAVPATVRAARATTGATPPAYERAPLSPHPRSLPSRLRRAGVAVATAFVLLPAVHLPTARAAAPTAWVCTLSEDLTRLVCIADVDPAEAEPIAAIPPTATVNGTRFPLDPRRVWQVDMWSPPTEPDFVLQLARATVCYRSPGCSVTMAGASWHAIAPHDAQLARSGRRP